MQTYTGYMQTYTADNYVKCPRSALLGDVFLVFPVLPFCFCAVLFVSALLAALNRAPVYRICEMFADVYMRYT